MLTRYTSFVAVQELVRAAANGDEVDQPLPLPEGVSDRAVGVTQGSEPELLWLAAIALALLGWVSLMRARGGHPGVAA